MAAATLTPHADAGTRWWAPLDTVTPPVLKPKPAARRLARDAALAALRHGLALSPAEAAQGLRRALNRGEGESAALMQALGAVIALTEHHGAVSTPVLEACWSLLNQGACPLATAAERQQALALSAACWALSGRPVAVLAADDEAAAQAARVSQPLLAALGLRSVAIAAEAPPASQRQAYAAEVVHVPARRLAADLARDRRERAQGDASRLETQLTARVRSAEPPLTRGLHTVLVDELDRVLFDDAVNAVLMSVPDDANALGPAIAQACAIADGLQAQQDYQLDRSRGLRWTAEGLQRVAAQAQRLPPLWRSAERFELLMLQALVVRDMMERGRDYAILANGQVHIDESLVERLPDRAILSGLTQALQTRLQMAQSPITRATDRTSVLTLVAGAARLGGVAAGLQGLTRPLWSRHGLCIDEPAEPLPALALETEILASEPRWQARLEQAFQNATTRRSRIYVLTHITDAARFAALPGAQGQAWVLAGLGPERALNAMHMAEQPPGHVLEIVFTEPMDCARAEAAFLRRAADACGLAVEGQVLLQPGARWFLESLGPLARPAAGLAALWPKSASPLLRGALRLLRWRAAGRQMGALTALALREQQLRLQLSFAGAPQAAPVAPIGAAATEFVDHTRRTP